MSLRRVLQSMAFLSLVGLSISVYLTWVYSRDVVPICLGGGGCAAVQHSRYAWIAGLPVPMLGSLVYAMITALTVAALWRTKEQRGLLLGLFGLTLTGLLFSLYLTYVEIWVIRAICLWCLASAAVIGLLFCQTLLARYLFTRA